MEGASGWASVTQGHGNKFKPATFGDKFVANLKPSNNTYLICNLKIGCFQIENMNHFIFDVNGNTFCVAVKNCSSIWSKI